MRKKEKLEHVPIVNYSRKQDLFNGVSHFVGVSIGLLIIIFSFIYYFSNKIIAPLFIGIIVFGLTAIALYLISGLYHILNPKNKFSKRALRIADHCTIYLLIAGTYTPICIYIGTHNIIGLVMLILQWFLALVGVILNIIDMNNKYVKITSMILYLLMGWMVIFFWAHIYLNMNAFLFILFGGIAYTIGSVLYGIGHKNLNFHGVFHIFVLIGTVLQAIGVFLL